MPTSSTSTTSSRPAPKNRTGMQQTSCRSFVVNFNLARRPGPTRPQTKPESEPEPQPFGGLEVGRGSRIFGGVLKEGGSRKTSLDP